MKYRTRVLVFAQASQEERSGIEEAYHRISKSLQGTHGLLGNELLHSTSNTNDYIVMSEWESLEAFKTWEEGPLHRQTTAPLRQYLTGATCYEVENTYPGAHIEVDMD